MSRTKSLGKTRQHPKRRQSSKPLPTPRSDVGVFFTGAQPAPAFPSDVILVLPKGARTLPTQISPLPVVAVRDTGAERLLVRKSPTTPDRKMPKPSTSTRKPNKTARANASKTLNGSQPRKGCKAAAGLQPIASFAKGTVQPQPQAIPLDARRPEGPAAAQIPTTAATTAMPAGIAPLPRSVAVTPYRKNGPFDALTYWLRSGGRSIAGLFKRPKTNALPKAAIIEINRLRLENLLLQRRIEMLLAEHSPAAQ